MTRCLRSFPRGLSGGPDGITPQHLQDMLSGEADEKLKNAITDFVNILLEGNSLLAARQIILGGRLIALQKTEASAPLSLATFYDVWLLNVRTVSLLPKEALNLSRSRLVVVCLAEQKPSFMLRDE